MDGLLCEVMSFHSPKTIRRREEILCQNVLIPWKRLKAFLSGEKVPEWGRNYNVPPAYNISRRELNKDDILKHLSFTTQGVAIYYLHFVGKKSGSVTWGDLYKST